MERKPSKPIKYNFCHSSFVYNNIQNWKAKSFVIDTRDPHYYTTSAIPGSINLHFDRISPQIENSKNPEDLSQIGVSHITKVLQEEELSKFNERKRRFCMLFVSETPLLHDFITEVKNMLSADEREECFEISESDLNDTLQALLARIKQENSVNLGLELYKALKKDRVSEIHILVDGAVDFFSRYPCMERNHFQGAKHTALYNFPHDILDRKLYLGTFKQAEQYEILQKLNIKRIVNTASECPNIHEDKDIKYKKLWIRDETDDNIAQHFKDVHDFIEEIFNDDSEGAILVHCALGKSRSAILVIMYIMKKFGWKYNKAYEYVKKRRQIICPFEGFVKKDIAEIEVNELKLCQTLEMENRESVTITYS